MKHSSRSEYVTVCQSVATMLTSSHYRVFSELSYLTLAKEVFLHEYIATFGLGAEDRILGIAYS